MKLSFTSCLSTIRTTALGLLLSGLLTQSYATTFTVTSTSDAGAGSLRAAITAANADAATPHVINFNISGSGVQTITLATNLPAITRTTTINGYSQPLASAGTFLTRNILIQLIVPSTQSSGITVDASNVVISGLNVVTAYGDPTGSPAGIYHGTNSVANNVWIWGCNFGTNAAGTLVDPGHGGYSIATYGNTTGPGAASTVSGWVVGTDGNGTNDAFEGNIFAPPTVTTSNVDLFRIFSADNFVIAGNYFGLSADGLTPLRAFNSTHAQNYGIAMSNCIGFRIGTDGNGTSDQIERNIFAGITGEGVTILGNPPSGNYNGDSRWPNRPNGNNLIAGNYFGTDKNGSGTDAGLANRTGISLRGATYATVGSLTNSIMRNVIVQSFSRGILIRGERYGTVSSTSQFNHVYGNYIGVLADGVTASPNAIGVVVNHNNLLLSGEISVYKNEISQNIIANNTGMGIAVNPSANSSGQLGLVYDNTFSKNSIYGNGALGINLGSTTNDFAVTPNDGTLNAPTNTNANRNMDYGIIKTASLSGNNLAIDGFIGISAAGTPNFGAGAIVEFFIADNTPANQNGERFAGDGQSLPHGEGRTYLGTLTANANGLFSGTLDVSGKGFVAGTSYITNTATEMAATGSTSEFGVNVTPLAIAGTVVIDGNGFSDNTVGGTGTNAGGTLFAALYDNTTGQVVDVVSVNPDGTYNFTGAISSTNYSIYLTTTAPTEGQTATPTVTLPAGMNNTGEVNCATAGCTGSDGTPDGVLNLGVLSSNTPNTVFGLNSGPVAGNDTGNGITGSSVSVNPLSNDSDTDGTIDAESVSLVAPSGATGIVTDANGDITSMTITGEGIWTVDPTTGAITFTPQSGFTGNPTVVQYTVDDNAGIASNPASVTITYTAPSTVSISGNVFHDANGNTVVDGGETLGTLPTPLYVYLVNSSGEIVDAATIGSGGSYLLDGVPNQSYTLELSTTVYPVGTNVNTTPIDNTLPTGLVPTGENGNSNTGSGDGTPNGVLAVTVGSGNVSNQNFGIDSQPNSNIVSHILTSQPASNDEILLNGIASPLPTGSDAEDGAYAGGTGTTNDPRGVVITSLPTHGELWYYGFGVPVLVSATDVANGTLFSDPSLFSLILTGTGYNSTTFEYAYVDAAGVVDPTPASYTISWGNPLPVKLVNFVARLENSVSRLAWSTAQEVNSDYFEVQHSLDAKHWTALGRVTARGESSVKKDYSYEHVDLNDGLNYYRLKMVDKDGTFAMSSIRSLRLENSGHVSLYPNPASDRFVLKDLDLSKVKSVKVLNTAGITVWENAGVLSGQGIKISLADGLYLVRIEKVDGSREILKLMVSK